MPTQETRKRLTVGVALIIVVVGAALIGMGTYAFFTDTETSDGNTVDPGTLDLTLDGNNGGVTGSFAMTNTGPGESVSHTFTLRNVGTKPADHVQVALSTTENDPRAEPSDSSIDTELNNTQTQQYVEVVAYEYRDDGGNTVQDLLSGVSDQNGNGIVDLEDVVAQSGSADDLPPPQANGSNTTQLYIELQIANDDGGSYTGPADENVMADGLDVVVDVRLNQDASQ